MSSGSVGTASKGSAVPRYLGRYAHRVDISNHRLLAFEGERVTFAYRDYARRNHILPRGFVRIRHAGFLANAPRRARVALARTLGARRRARAHIPPSRPASSSRLLA